MAPKMTLESEIEEEFNEFGIDIQGNLALTDKLCDISNSHGLDASTLVANWMTFSLANSSNHDLTPDALDNFEKTLFVKQKKATQPRSRASVGFDTSRNSYRKFDDREDEEEAVFQGYTPSSGKKLKRHISSPHTPDNDFDKASNGHVTPVTSRIKNQTKLFSPASFSPALAGPSPKYNSRQSRGDAVATYNCSLEDKSWSCKGHNNNIKLKGKSPLTAAYRFMFQKLADKAEVVNSMVNAMEEQMKVSENIDELQNVSTSTQESAVFGGRIRCDAIGKLNSKSILLEGSMDTSQGEKIRLDVSDVAGYSLFPGQNVLVHGINPSGSQIHASKLHDGLILPFSKNDDEDQFDEVAFTVFVCAGPYSTSEDRKLSFAPLVDLLSAVERNPPDFLILNGPFVDSKQDVIQSAEVDMTFDELFNECCLQILSAAKRDVFHTPIYPQPPFTQCPSELKNIHFVSDPCTLSINGVTFGITSTDILFHLGAEEISSNAPGSSDRLSRLACHLLKQQCYYPLHPANEDVNIDYAMFEKHCFMAETPDVLIVPSDLRYFIKDVNGCLSVNPGRLVKGAAGGTYAKLSLKPTSSKEHGSVQLAMSKGHILRI